MFTLPALYRTYLRQAKSLPHEYLRHFFAIKAADDFRSLLKTHSPQLRQTKLKRVSKDLRCLQAANRGQSVAFDRMLHIAYGRVGKLRRELMEPLLSGSLSSTNSRTERTCSPVYSPELAALLTSTISRTTKPLQKHHLISPPGFPERAKPNSQDAVVFGPLSRRREYNIRWRFFKNECKKVYPPFHLPPQHPENCAITLHSSGSLVVDHGLQNAVIFQELLALAEPPSDPTSSLRPFHPRPSIRWLRRRYQALLGKIPLLVPRPLSQDKVKPTYDVRLADNAITAPRPHPPRLRVVEPQDMPWIRDVHLTPIQNASQVI